MPSLMKNINVNDFMMFNYNFFIEAVSFNGSCYNN